jgi:uncharacterized membrane protein
MSKKQKCIKSGASPLFCNLAEGGRIIYTINLVLTLSVSAIILIVSLVLFGTAKPPKNTSDDKKKEATSQAKSQAKSQKTAGIVGMVGALLFALPTVIVWMLVQKFDIIAVISIIIFILSSISAVVAGSRLSDMIRKSTTAKRAEGTCIEEDCKSKNKCRTKQGVGTCETVDNKCGCQPPNKKIEKYGLTRDKLKNMTPHQLKSTAMGISGKDACQLLMPVFCWDHTRNICLPFATEIFNENCY